MSKDRKNLLKIAFVFLLFFIFGIIILVDQSFGQTVAIDKLLHNHGMVEPGTVIEGKINLYNQSEEFVSMTAMVDDLESNKHSLKDFVTLEAGAFKLQPGLNSVLHYQIKVPDDIQGTLHTCIILNPVKPNVEVHGAKIKAGFAVRVLVSSEGEAHIRIKGVEFDNEKYELKVIVENQGNLAKPYMCWIEVDGQKFESGLRRIYPSGHGEYIFDLSHLEDGMHRVFIAVEDEHGTDIIPTRFEFRKGVEPEMVPLPVLEGSVSQIQRSTDSYLTFYITPTIGTFRRSLRITSGLRLWNRFYLSFGSGYNYFTESKRDFKSYTGRLSYRLFNGLSISAGISKYGESLMESYGAVLNLLGIHGTFNYQRNNWTQNANFQVSKNFKNVSFNVFGYLTEYRTDINLSCTIPIKIKLN